MSESRTNNSIKNAATGIIYKLIGIFCPFIIRTVMIRKLGAEYLGLNSLFTSILQMLSLSELGIGNAMVYSMYKPIAEKDTKRVCALLSLYRKYYRYIGVVILILGLVISPFLEYFIKGSYPADINIHVLYFIYLGNTVISYFLFAYKKSILDATQKVSIENCIQTILTTIMYVLQIAALFFTRNYYVYIVFLPCTTFLVNIIRYVTVNKMYPQYVCSGTVEKGFIDDLKLKIKALIGHKIGANVIWFSDSIVISTFLGLNVLAIYSNYYYIMNAIIGLLAIVYNSILASVGNSLVTEKEEKNYLDFKNLNFGNTWIVAWCSICLVCMYQPFMELWMGKNLMFPMEIVVLFAVYFYTWMFNKVANTYMNAAGLWSEAFWKPYVSSIINLLLNIILVNIIGIAGVLISTIVASVFIETPWESSVLHRCLFKRKAITYYKQLIVSVMFTAFCGGITYKICQLIMVDNLIGTLIIRLLICLSIPNIIFIVLFHNTEEFIYIISKLKRIVCRWCK